MEKIYRMYGIDTAMELLRPEAKWEFDGKQFTRWEDPRPQPSVEEVYETMEKIKTFEDSINTIWLPEKYDEIMEFQKKMDNAIRGNS